ncbi:MAG: S-methyl-5-thioribose-1-phosphate isomerase [bacterium]
MIPRIRMKPGALEILDQRLLPNRIAYVKAETPEAVAKAISGMVLRGAPLIGCTAAYGYAFALKAKHPRSWHKLMARLKKTAGLLKASRPTAVALMYAVDRLHSAAEKFISAMPCGAVSRADYSRLVRMVNAEAKAVFDDDVRANARMGRIGSALLRKGSVVITHCNAGALATAGIGTALGVITTAHRQGKIRHAYSCETRPYMQGSRLTIWELQKARVPSTLITDSMAAHIMKTCAVTAVIVGADRIAANGDTANKIGTYGLAVLARHHGIPFYVAAPAPTFDLSAASGKDIPVEERSSEEVCEIRGIRLAPRGVKARHPAFDVTPAALITGLITEKGLIKPVNRKNILRILRLK